MNQVIVELDQLMETSFRETFQKIAEEFKGMFQKLFGGGSAKLVLTDPENIAADRRGGDGASARQETAGAWRCYRAANDR